MPRFGSWISPRKRCSSADGPWPRKIRAHRIAWHLPLALAITCCAGSAQLSAAEEAPPAPTSQAESAVLALLQAKCARCHSGEAPKAELDLTSLAGIRRGGESGKVIVPGKVDESPLYERIHDGSMPPEEKDRLSADEIELVRSWIETGDSAPAETAALTQHDVLPILLRRCTVCHGARRQEAGLDLRSRASMLRGGKSGPAVVVGAPDDSLLVKRILANEMPPRDRLVEVSIKPIDPTESETIERWISAGAPEADIAPDIATTAPDPAVTDEDRAFWAFQAPRPVEIPQVASDAAVQNPIDAFVIEKLAARQLTLSPAADRLTLLRRATYDLTGLPPTPDEVAAFLADNSDDAYEKLIDRLLASPRYGERWARIWLDVAGYADSEGKREQDLPRTEAWRYRDYVIRALNTDKPYDRFLLEQLAGDELADYEHAPEITPEIYDNLVATGFLRMAPDATWANITGYLDDRLEVIADEIDVLGSAVMGMTLKCARCHSHKFDPIPHRDYYRLAAIFKGAFDEHDWLKPDVRPGLGPLSQDILTGRHLSYVTTAERQAWEANNARIEREAKDLSAALGQQAEAARAKLLDARLLQLPEELRSDLRAMLSTPAEKRNEVQKYLAEKLEAQLRFDDAALRAADPTYKSAAEEADRRIKELRAQATPEPRIHALWDRGEPSPTYIYRRGDPLTPGRLVGPGVPSVLTDGHTPLDVQPPPGGHSTGRRLAFARWLTRPDHPLTARVMVNRLWKHHFGTGIVKTLGNFGRAGSPPTHPELLDWLAREFVARGWSQKQIHRLMMTSATYRQSSAVTDERERLDPDNALVSRMPLVRLDAEQLYDALLAVAGRLDETRYGPGDAVQVRADGLMTPVGTERGWRRLIYVKQMRKQMPTHMESFDYPQMNPNCVERRDSTVAPQALHLMNNGMVRQLAERFAARVAAEAGTSDEQRIDRLYLLALARHPTTEELETCRESLRQVNEVLAAESPPATTSTAPATDKITDGEALTTLCHAIMNSAAFLFVD